MNTSSTKTKARAADPDAGPAPEPGRPNGLRIFSGALIEACWLAALAVIPLLYNSYGYRGFDPEKVIFLRIFAIIALCAWILRAFHGVAPRAPAAVRGGSPVRIPFVLSLAALSIAYLLSTCFSVNPGASLWGSNDFRQGTITFFAGLALLASVAAHARTAEQFERLVTIVLATSLPVALYAILQRTGIDPLGIENEQGRVGSTVGHSTFLAGYLVMVIPLTAWRLLGLGGSLRDHPGTRDLRVAAIIFYSVLAAIQLMGFLSAQSRGPLLGLGAALFFVAVGFSVYRRQWLLLKIAAALAVCVLGGLLLLGMPNGPFSRWSSLPALRHFARTLPLAGEADRFRAEIWQQAPKVMLSPSPLPFAVGGEDRFHWLRPLIGYGPETLTNVLPRFFDVRVINATRIELRFHNVIWDTWFGIGGFGLAALLAFIILLFLFGYRWLGWMGSKRAQIAFGMLVACGAAAGAAALWILKGPGFAGLGLVVGMVAGLMIHPLLARSRKGSSPSEMLPESSATLLIVLLGAIAGHLVEIGFSFPMPTTLLLFNVYSGLIIALGRGFHTTSEVDRPTRKPAAAPPPGPAYIAPRQKPRKAGTPSENIEKKTRWECAIFAAIILSTLVFTFVRVLSAEPLTLGDVLRSSLVEYGPEHSPSCSLLLLLIATWLGINFAFASDAALRKNGLNFSRILAGSALLSGLIAGTYLLVRAGEIVRIGPILPTDATEPAVLSQCFGYEIIGILFVAFMIGLAAAGGAMLARPAVEQPSRAGNRWIVIAGTLAAIALMVVTAIQPLRADVAAGWAKSLMDLGLRTQSAAVSRRALALGPHDPVYLRILARALANSTGDLPDVGDEASIREAERLLLEARAITSGMDPATYELGRLYLSWAGWETTPELALAVARKASAVFDQSLIYEPGSPYTWNDSANVDLLYLNRPDDARRKIQQAVDIVANRQREWGDYCSACSLNAHDPNLQRQYEARAMEAYRRGIGDPGLNARDKALCHLGEGDLLLARGETDSALATLLDVLKYPIGDQAWRAEAGVGIIYLQQGKPGAAHDFFARALAHAPAGQKPRLTQLLAQTQPQ